MVSTNTATPTLSRLGGRFINPSSGAIPNQSGELLQGIGVLTMWLNEFDPPCYPLDDHLGHT